MGSDKIMLTFAGQAGFIIENSRGYTIGIDLYLSDCCERYFGFKRLMPFVFDPLDLELDLLVATHAHYDHFDPDSVPLIMSNKNTKLLCTYDVAPEAERLNLDKKRIEYIKTGDVFSDENVKITAVECDHGPDTPDAVGLLIEMSGKKIYITGDTAYREDCFKNNLLKDTNVLIMPINGAFGNMNEEEGARAADIIKPEIAIPCHYWNFAEHGGNPGVFAEHMKNSQVPYILMRQGETINI